MAASRGITTLGIADHESVGAFLLDGGAIDGLAAALQVTLLPAIEIDAELDGREVHVLGQGIDPLSAALTAHCDEIQRLRRRRTREELEQANAALGRPALDPDRVFAEPRQTFMRPNLIMPLLDEGVFPTYEAAARWFKEHVRPATTLRRLTLAQAFSLIHQAGGLAYLAHPGYGVRDGWLDPERDFPAFRAQGLDGVEIDYPYAACSPHLYDLNQEDAAIRQFRDAASRAGLMITAGSDSHRLAEFEERWSLETRNV